ncbi:hypothetical protein P9112_009225 [Eukaryota sp. TZLM1-RC]
MCQWSVPLVVTIRTTLCRELCNRFTAQAKFALSTAPDVHARSSRLYPLSSTSDHTPILKRTNATSRHVISFTPNHNC